MAKKRIAAISALWLLLARDVRGDEISGVENIEQSSGVSPSDAHHMDTERLDAGPLPELKSSKVRDEDCDYALVDEIVVSEVYRDLMSGEAFKELTEEANEGNTLSALLIETDKERRARWDILFDCDPRNEKLRELAQKIRDVKPGKSAAEVQEKAFMALIVEVAKQHIDDIEQFYPQADFLKLSDGLLKRAEGKLKKAGGFLYKEDVLRDKLHDVVDENYERFGLFALQADLAQALQVHPSLQKSTQKAVQQAFSKLITKEIDVHVRALKQKKEEMGPILEV